MKTQDLTLDQTSPKSAKTSKDTGLRSRVASSVSLQPFDTRKEVFFEINAGAAKEVLLAGDFTDWEKAPIKLRKGEFGAWYITVMLAPGRYHYKFKVDGHWQEDPAASENCPNPFASNDSVLDLS